MKLITLIVIILLSNTLLNAQTNTYFFGGNFNEIHSGPSLTEILGCSASTGTFGNDLIVTSNGICGSDSANTFKFNSGGGIQYLNAGLVSKSYTINVFFKFNALGGWSRIIDFSNSTADAGIYLLGDCLNFFPNGNVGPCPYFKDSIFYLLSFVRDSATKVIKVYVDGSLFSSYNDVNDTYISANGTTPVNFFRDDNAVPCEVKSGSIKYLTLSHDTLSATQIDSIWRNICTIALPLKLISFTGSVHNGAALLNWTTSSEVNSAYFGIEQSSNGQNFNEVGRIVAKNNNAASSAYSFDNSKLLQGNNFYRLKLADKDGKYSYSPVIKLSINGSNTVQVFPNPATNNITVSGVAQGGYISLASTEGKILFMQKVTSQTMIINIEKLPHGIYIFHYSNGQNSYTQKVVKR